MLSTVLDAFFWFASLLNAGLLAHQLFTIWRTKNAEGLSILMMGGFLVMQIIYAMEGFRTSNLAMLMGWSLSVACTAGIIALATRYNRLLRMSADQQQILNAVEKAFGDNQTVFLEHLREKGLQMAEIESLVVDGFLVAARRDGLAWIEFASAALRKEIVARRWQ